MTQYKMPPPVPGSPRYELREDITETQTTIPLATIEGVPDAPNRLTFYYHGEVETIYYTGIDRETATLTGVTRGEGGTKAKAWLAGMQLARLFCAADYEAITHNIEDHEGRVDLLETSSDTHETRIGALEVGTADHAADRTNPHQVTPAQVRNTDPQWNADQIQSIQVDTTNLGHKKTLVYNGTLDKLEFVSHDDLDGTGTHSHTDLDAHVTDLKIHRPLDDAVISGTNLWSSQKTRTEIDAVNTDLGAHADTAEIHRSIDDITPSATGLWSSQKTKNEIDAVNNVTKVDDHIATDEIHRSIDDITPSATGLWSSQKTRGEIDAVNAEFKTHAGTNEIHRLIDDIATSETNLWSSQKIKNEIGAVNNVDKVDAHIANAAEHRTINDSSATATDLWSAQKITNELATKSNTGHTHPSTEISISGKTTDNLTEGQTNLYYTQDRVKTVIRAEKGIVNGLATLGTDGKIPSSQIPPVAITDTHVVETEAEQLNLDIQQGDICIRLDLGKSYINRDGINTGMGDWIELKSTGDQVSSVNGKIGAVTLTTTDVEEGNKLYYTEGRVTANPTVTANAAARHVHTNAEVLSGTTAPFTTALKIKLDNIETGATADQIASEVPFTPYGDIVATDVQTAIQELRDDTQSKLDTKEPVITKKTAFNKDFGTVSGTVCEGNDIRLTDSRTPKTHTHAGSEVTSAVANATTAASCSGNAATATKLATARTISLGGDCSGSTTFDGSANKTITVVVADDSHNHVIGNVDGLQTSLNGKAASSHTHTIGQVSIDANKNWNGKKITNLATPTASTDAATKAYVDTAIPIGGIILWSGSIASIPSNWKLCDGRNGTPDLRDRFVVGAGHGYAVGATGGEATHVLTINEMPAHSHSVATTGAGGAGRIGNAGSSDSVKNVNTTSVGGGQPHENRPPYYALAYIMRVA